MGLIETTDTPCIELHCDGYGVYEKFPIRCKLCSRFLRRISPKLATVDNYSDGMGVFSD